MIGLVALRMLRAMGAGVRHREVLTEIFDKTHALQVLAASDEEGAVRADRRQVEALLGSLDRLLNKVSSQSAREDVLVRQLRRSCNDLEPLMEQWFTSVRAPGGLEKARHDTLASQIWIKVQFVSDDIRRLRDISRERTAAAQERTGLAVVGLIVLLALSNGLIYLLCVRSIVRGQRALVQREQALREALRDTQLLHRLTMDLAGPGEPRELYERIMDAAVEIMRSDFASLQMLDPQRGLGPGELRLLAHRGFPPDAAAHWEWVSADRECACGIALKSGERCHAADLTQDTRIGGREREVYVQMGILAVQTTPLVSRDGRLLGAISTHWKAPHAPEAISQRDWRMFDVLARHAADLLERVQAEQALRALNASLQSIVDQRTDEVRRAERALAASQRMAAVGTLAAGLAHDMKNVLMPLSTRLDFVMAASGLTGEARTDLTVVVALLDHLREMARSLSLFASDPDQEGAEASTSLPAWCSRVKGLIEASIADSARAPGGWIRIKWDIPEGTPPLAIAPHRLTQAVLNVVHNARDAIVTAHQEETTAAPGAPPPGCITIAARPAPDGSLVEVSVTDDGCGMDDETRQRCTEPFYTTKDRPAATGLAGSGLGLALVRAIAERAGGELRISSEPGKGTTITIALPVAPPRDPPAPSPPRLARVSVEDKRTRALVIEALRSLRYEAVDGRPEADSPSTLWVTDRASARPDQAAAFLGLRQGQRVIALGGDDDWRAAGAIVCEPSKVRRILSGVAPGAAASPP